MNEHTYLPEGESYQVFFERLADRLRSEHGFDAGSGARADRNWRDFPTGFARIRYAASFCTEPREGFRVEVYLQHPDKDWNKQVFDSLRERGPEIEADFGSPLSWERKDGAARSRIAAYLDDKPRTADELREWAVRNLVGLREAVVSRLPQVLD